MQPNTQNDDLSGIIAKTEELLQHYAPPDPSMVSVLAQLKAMQAGADPSQLAIGRTIMYNLEPAPNAEIQAWCDAVLKLWEQRGNQNGILARPAGAVQNPGP